MSDEQLSDADLRELAIRFPTHMGEPAISVLVQRAVSELRAHRQAALTAEEREALKWLRDAVTDEIPHAYGPNMRHAIATLDRLLGGVER